MRLNFTGKIKEKNVWGQEMKIKVELHKQEIRALMTCLSMMDEAKASRQQMIILDKINPDKLYTKLSNILFECTFPGNIK